MNRKRQRRKQLQENWNNMRKKSKALSWVLCVALLSGSVCVPEYTGISVWAAESAEMSEEMAEVAVADVSNQENVSEQDGAWQENCPSWDATDVSGGDGSSEDEVLKLVSLNSEEDNIAGGSYENITWGIDAEGKLIVEGTGEFSAQMSWERAPWYSQRENIKSAVVCVTGLKDASYMFNGCKNLQSIDLSGFDTGSVTSMSYMFSNCSSLASLDVSGFDTSSVTSMSSMFGGCNSLTSLDVSGFDTSSVTSMSSMFGGCNSLTSLDVSGFDTSNVTYMEYMFWDCSSLTSLDLSGFNTSSVKDKNMYDMFLSCHSIAQIKTFPNLQQTVILPVKMHDEEGNVYKYFPVGLTESITLYTEECGNILWEINANGKLTVKGTGEFSVLTSRSRAPWHDQSDDIKYAEVCITDLKDASYMFEDCYNLESVDLSGFDTSSVTDMSSMFGGCNSLTSLDVSGFDTSSVTDMSGMFVNCRGLASLDLSGFDTSSVTSMGLIFSYCSSLTSLDLSGFKTSSVTDMSGMFYDCNSLTSLDVSNFDTSSVTSMSGMFYGCSSLTSLNLSSFITSNVTNMGGIPMNVNFKDGMFGDCSSLISLDLSSFDTSSVIDMCYMFDGCSSLTSLNVSGFNTSNVTDMGYMFRNCVGLTSLDVSGFNTSSVTSMSCMFKNCVGLTNLDVSGFDTSSVTAMVYMFGGCSSLTSLDLSSFDIREIKDGEYDDDDYYYWWEGMICIFDGCSNLSTLYTPYNVPALFGDSKASLPITEESDVWFDAAGNTYTTLPEGLDYSIVLTKNAIPAPDAMQAKLMVRLAKTSYEPGSVIQPEDLTVKYRGTDGRTITLSYQGDNADVQGYTMSIVDMNTPGTKTLTISYNDGTDTLTESVTFIVLENSVDPDDPNNPTDPTDPTFPDDGTFRISAVSAQIYTGSAIKPVVTVYYGSRRLTEKTDYAVTYKNNIKANDATAEQTAPTITVTGKGNYSGKQTITFVINPKDITEEDMTVAELIAAQSNKIQKPVPTLTWQGRKLKNKTDFTVSYPDESKSGAYQMTGTYTVAVTGTGNYTGTKNLTYTITNKTLLTNAKVTVKAKDYTGSAVTLSTEDITVKVGKDTLIYGIDYTLSYRNNTQAGKATVIVTGTGDSYAGSKEVAFQIKGESLAKAQITGVVDKTYTGTAQTQNIQVQLNGKTLQEGTDYTVSYAKEVTAGTASVIVTGKGGYTGTVKKSFKIMAYDLQADEAGKLQGVPKNLTTVYVKGGATPTLTLTFNGKTLETKKDYTVTYQNNKKPATAGDAKAPTMLIKGKGNFKGIISIPFTIGVSNLETDGNVTITAADTAYVNKTGKYAVKPVLTDANGKKLTAGTDYEKTLTYALINSDGTETVLTTADIVPEGSTVKVTATGKGSYTGTLSATYHITKVSFSKAKITVNPQIYTGVPVTLSEKDVTVKIDSATLTYGKDYTIVPGSYQNNTKKGTATVTIKGMGDYGGTKTVKFKVTAKPLAAWLKF